MLINYQAEFPEDDLNCEIQLGEANGIIKVIERAGDRWEAVEKTLDDLKSCIFQSLTLTDIDAQIEKVDAAMIEYDVLNSLQKLKKQMTGQTSSLIIKLTPTLPTTHSKHQSSSHNQN